MPKNEVDTFSCIRSIITNRLLSLVIMVVIGAMIFGVSLLLGKALGSTQQGLAIGALVVFGAIPLQVLMARFAIIAIAKGRAASPKIPQEAAMMETLKELSREAGLSSCPKLYISSISSPNAFASGLTQGSSFICVTKGLMDSMNEQELAGVLGHEVGHIRHGDVLLNQVIAGMISGLILLVGILRFVGYAGGGRRRNAIGAVGICLLAAFVLQPLVSLISALLQMAISRRREFAADAFSAKINGSSTGIANALEKLGQCEKHMTSEMKEELGGQTMAAMYISFPSSWFSTHPPIEKRVEALREMEY